MTRSRLGIRTAIALAIATIDLLWLRAPISARTQDAAAVVSGVVVSDETPARPLRRATVSLVAGGLRVPLTTITDDRGTFTFANVPPGHYGVVASKPAYVGAFYGSKRPGRGPGVPVAVPAGGRVANLRLTLVRGSVIAGTLRLPSGQPALNMPVVVAEVETVNGTRRLRPTGGRTTSDDRGEYRVFGLPAGQYIVRAQPSGLLTGALTGASDAPQTTAAEVSWAQEQARRRPGDPTVAAASPAPGPERGRTMNYAAVYFPGTTDPSAAAAVQIGAGEERRGVDFALALVATAKVAGTVLGLDGQPSASASIALVAKDDTTNVLSQLSPRPAIRSGADGSFAIPAVAPGRYQLSARATTSGNDAWAMQDVIVDGREVGSVVLAMQPGMTVSGRLTFDAATRPAPTNDEISRARVTIAPVTSGGGGAADVMAAGASSATASVAPDGRFAVTGLAPDSYRISVTMPGAATGNSAPAGAWTLRSITTGVQDVTDRAIEIRPRENLADVVVRFTDRPTVISGTLVDQANRAASPYPIVVFSTNRADWRAGSRRVVVARPSTDGSFRVVGLPPGAYYVCAVLAVDAADLEDPAFFDQLVPGALTVTLSEGQALVQSLRVGGRP